VTANASSFRSPASLPHRHNKAQRVRQSHEAMRRVDAGCRFVQRVDDHHGRAHRVGALERALQRVGKQDLPKALALLVPGDRQPAGQGAADERIAGNVLPRRFRHLALRDRHRAERVITQDRIRLGIPAQHEDGVCLPPDVPPSLCLEIAVETLDPTGEAVPVVRVVQDGDTKISGCGTRHSPHDPALMLRESPLEPFIRSRRVDERIKEHSAVAI
jgi:hypothetical protein